MGKLDLPKNFLKLKKMLKLLGVIAPRVKITQVVSGGVTLPFHNLQLFWFSSSLKQRDHICLHMPCQTLIS